MGSVVPRRLVYLDQNHLSTIAKARVGTITDPVATEVDRLLGALVSANRILCPYSMYHVLETARLLHDVHRAALCMLVEELSQGSCFRYFTDLLASEVLLLVRPIAGSDLDVTSPLGESTDCFPMGVVDQHMARLLASLEDGLVFNEIVSGLMRDEQLLAEFERARNDVIGHEGRVVAARASEKFSFAEALRREKKDYLDSPDVENVTQRVAQFTGLSACSILKELVRTLDAVPTLSAVVELRAVRDTRRGMKPHPGDFMDSCHMVFMPHVDLFATDARSASIASDVGRRQSVRVVARLHELRDVLRSWYRQSDVLQKPSR